jgi:hypothetical protein
MKTFDDLKFGTHKSGRGIAARLTFDNGYEISLVANTGGLDWFYGDYPDTYEVAVLNPRGKLIPICERGFDTIRTHQNKTQVSNLMIQFQEDGPRLEKSMRAVYEEYWAKSNCGDEDDEEEALEEEEEDGERVTRDQDSFGKKRKRIYGDEEDEEEEEEGGFKLLLPRDQDSFGKKQQTNVTFEFRRDGHEQAFAYCVENVTNDMTWGTVFQGALREDFHVSKTGVFSGLPSTANDWDWNDFVSTAGQAKKAFWITIPRMGTQIQTLLGAVKVNSILYQARPERPIPVKIEVRAMVDDQVQGPDDATLAAIAGGF